MIFKIISNFLGVNIFDSHGTIKYYGKFNFLKNSLIWKRRKKIVEKKDREKLTRSGTDLNRVIIRPESAYMPPVVCSDWNAWCQLLTCTILMPTLLPLVLFLSLVEEKFEDVEYTSITEFVADVRQIFENCYRYNGLKHMVSRQAQMMECHFEQKLTQLSRWERRFKFI